MTPSTVAQLAILVAFVLPGSVYQAVRARLAGEVPANRDLSNRVLRALAASVVLDSLYGIVLGPLLLRVLGRRDPRRFDGRWYAHHVRLASLLGLLLLFAVPAGLACFAARRYAVGDWLAQLRHRGALRTTWGCPNARLRCLANWSRGLLATRCATHGGLRYDPTPTAWDWAVDHGGSGEGFVRVRTENSWRGGLFRGNSYFSAFPDKPAVFVQQAWQLDENGAFVNPQPGSTGAWIPCERATTVEFLNPVEGSP